jgi:TATA-binding protein-associated factor
MPNFLGNYSYFAEEYAQPIAKSHSPDASASLIAEGMKKLKVLHQQVLPFVLRRDKNTVLKELPPKIISKVSVSMSDIQASLYTRACLRSDTRLSLQKLESILLADTEKVTTDGADDMNILKSLMLLRLLCTHPALLLDRTQLNISNNRMMTVEASGKFVALVDLFRLSGYFNDSMYCADKDSSLFYCNDESTIIDVLADTDIHDHDCPPSKHVSKCLLFAQFKDSLDLVEALILKPMMPSMKYLRLDGNTPVSKRTEIATRFNYDPAIKLLLLTTRVGGLGLNLTGQYICGKLHSTVSVSLLFHLANLSTFFYRRRYCYIPGKRLQPFCRSSSNGSSSSNWSK